MHQDDVVTRMKNIDMIELGKHRIKPWYFSPYPQVRKKTRMLIEFKEYLFFSFKGIMPNAMYLYL